MKRREFMTTISAVIAVPLLSVAGNKGDTDVITYRETLDGSMERIEFEELHIGDVAQFVDPHHGPHAGRWKIGSEPKRVRNEDGTLTWGVRTKRIDL